MVNFELFRVLFRVCLQFLHRYFALVSAVFMVTLTLLFALFALFRPLNVEQLEHVQRFAVQAELPNTQQLAIELLDQPQLYRGHYLKLMQAYQTEHAAQRTYAAIEISASALQVSHTLP